MTPLVRHFLRRISLRRALLAGATGAVLLLLALPEKSSSQTLGEAQAFVWVIILLVAFLGLYPLGASDWALPLPRRKLFDSVAWAYLIAGQLASLPPLLLGLSKSASSPAASIAHALCLQALAALFQVLAVITLPFWTLHVTLGQLTVLILLLGSFCGAALGLAYAPAPAAALIAPACLALAAGAWRLGQWLYTRYEPAAGLGVLDSASRMAGGKLADASLSSFRAGWPDLVGRLPPRWRYLTRCIYGTWSYVAGGLGCAVMGPLSVQEGMYHLAIISVLAGATATNLLASRLPSLASFSRATLHGAVFLPLLGLSLASGVVVLLIHLATGDPSTSRGDLVIVLAVPFAILSGAAGWLPSRGGLLRNTPLFPGMFITFLAFAFFLVEGVRQFAYLGNYSHWRREQAAGLHAFLAEHATILGPALLVACLLLYLRNQRACRWLEYRPLPFGRPGP